MGDELGGADIGRQAVVLWLASVAQSRLSTLACPLVGGSRPSRILIRVDFPAPLDPTSPVMPGSMTTVSPSSAVTGPG